MSKYTTMLRWLVESYGEGHDVPVGQRYPDEVYKALGLSEYPIFDANYRAPLNDKIIDHFYFREIGFETAGMFSFYMRRTMNEIMPKYNALYAAQMTIDLEHPLSDYARHYVELWNENRNETWTADRDEEWSRTHDRSWAEDKSRNWAEDKSRNWTEDRSGNWSEDKDENWTEAKEKTIDKTGYENASSDTEQDWSEVDGESASTVKSDNMETSVIGSSSGENSNTSSNTSHNRNVFQDTPMSLLNNDPTSGQPTIEGLNYATTVTYDDGSGTTQDSGSTESVSSESTSQSRDMSESVDKTTDNLGSKTESTEASKMVSSNDVESEDGSGTKVNSSVGHDDSDGSGTDAASSVGTDGEQSVGADNRSDAGQSSRDDTGTKVNDDDGDKRFDVYGINRSWASLMEELADKWVNIDMLVIDDLETLFMGVW